ncbi:hydrolase [Altererythrobacter sp. B11]|uniref:hydrolase n=1 Tax=Altererythrobacter sp. B11 TaxID=2060312 RepID=UPI000DC71C83|nr:hydrolase [Altererythrobacter sp. B11]BBC73339.1 hydrolase [Altererythrobacter sp. B11]
MTKKLIVALHGVGSNARDMMSALQPLTSQTDVVALDGPEPFHANALGRQWFSVAGITEANRPGRVKAAVPQLLEMLDRVAQDRGVRRDDLVLIGFSQGAIMTLAAIAGGHFHGHAVAIAGRLAAEVASQSQPANLLLVHDRDDPVMPPTLSVEAGAALSRAGHQVHGARTAGVGHGIGETTTSIINRWLAGAKLENAV